MKFYVAIASALAAKNYCVERKHTALVHEWAAYIDDTVREHAPRGSGFNEGTHISALKSAIGGNKPQRLVFDTAFHHMADGYYTHHEVWVYPWFDGFNIRITGRDDNDIKELIHDAFNLLGNVEVMSLADYRAKGKVMP